MKDSLVRIYLAGPLFTAAELAYNKLIKDLILESLEDVRVYLPQEHEQEHVGFYAPSIFLADKTAIDESDIVVAVLDGSDVDSGTAWEVGYAYSPRNSCLWSSFRYSLVWT